MSKKTEVVCARVSEALATRIRENAESLNARSQGFVIRVALERYYAAVDAGKLPPITETIPS